MAYLVQHTLNRNETYTGGKQNPLPIHGKSPTDKSKYKKKSETNKSTLFFHSNSIDESVILNVQYMG